MTKPEVYQDYMALQEHESELKDKNASWEIYLANGRNWLRNNVKTVQKNFNSFQFIQIWLSTAPSTVSVHNYRLKLALRGFFMRKMATLLVKDFLSTELSTLSTILTILFQSITSCLCCS